MNFSKLDSSMAIFAGPLGSCSGSECLQHLLVACLSAAESNSNAISDYVSEMSAFLASESKDPRVSHLFPLGFDVDGWIQHPPDSKYLDAAPVSFVLVGLLQLVRFLHFVHRDDNNTNFKAFAGHSLGAVVAVAAASYSQGDIACFKAASKTALGTLLLASCVPLSFKLPTSTLHEETAMASVRGVPQFVVDTVLKKYNTFKGHNAVHVASIDVDNYHLTCAGESVSTMAHFIKQVRQRMAATQGSAGDQSDIPFHKRKPDAVIDFHPHVYAPLHCGDLLVSAVEQHMTFAVSKGWLFSAKDLHDSTVSAFTNGKNVFSGVQDLDLTRTMVEYIYTQQVDWPSTLLSEKDSIMRIVDFGPSGGPMPLHEQTVLTIQGRGIQLLQYADSRAPLDTTLSPAANWRTQFGPAVFDSSNNMLHTRLSNLIGLPPVFVGATAPTTRSVDFVAAVAHAGYHAELSVEDTLSSDELADRITRLADAIPPGHGITVSCRANHKDDDSRQQWQLRAIARLRQQNQHPIIGVCVNDSISASEIAMLQRAGIRYIALRAAKPSDIDGALGIAQSCAAFPVVIQWTGGRCGGVHSFEDFHIPLLVDAYGRMRAQGNVVLVASSGFGDADGVVPYLTGAWGEMFNRSCMPFDGVMLSSRMMVARESPVADAAKQLIVSRAPGVDPFDMLALFGDAPEGGIVSIRNEHGQPRHVVANRAAKFCHKVSAEILLQPRDKVASALKANRDWILRGLCKDFMRPWFGQSEHPLELSEMTYIQVIDRLVELMHVAAEHRWIHATYRNFVAKFVRRTSMRLQNAEHAFMPELKQGVVYDDAVFDEIATVKLAYPDAHTQLLASADIQYFASLCKRPGQKAVPFVPFLDADFADYLMRDTEWQCQDLASVYNGSAGLDDAAQRVLLNHGPVAARYSLVANEPVNDIMDRIYNGAVQLIIPELPATDIEQLDPESLLSMESLEHTVIAYHSSEGRTYQLPLHPQSEGPETLPSIRAWHRVLPRSSDSKGNTNNNNWLHSILTSPAIVQDKKLVDNYVSRLLRPRYGRAVTVIDDATAVNSQASPLSVKVWNNGSTPTTLETSHRSSSLELSLTLCNDNVIELVLPHRNSSLVLRFLYTGNKTPLAPIHEIMDGRDYRIARFYTDLWRRGTDTQTPAIPSPSSTSMSCCTAPQTYTQCRVPVCRDFSLDMLAIEALPGVFGILTDGCVSAGLLDMVQTEYAVEKCNGGSLFASLSQGDELDIVSRVNEMRTVPGLGKQVVAVSDVFVSGTKRKCAEIRATFLFKGAAVAPGRCFRHVEEPTATISAIAGDVLKVLESKEWFYHIVSDQRAREGDTLEFHLRSEYTLSSTGAYLHAATKGSVNLVQGLHDRLHIADIDYEEGASVGNPVIAFLDSHKQSLTTGSDFACTKTLARDTVTVPCTAAHAFADTAGDHNPHNTSDYFADLAGLPGPVMQGLWTCSSVRQLIDLHVAQGDAGRMQSFQAQLTGMVYPGDKLETQLVHSGMRNGQMVVSGHTRNTATGELVLECTALVAQPPTVYVFTGQGSQEIGMGLEWAQRSAAVRSVYERADKHMRWRFGFSIVDIIRDNPTEYTVYFNSDEAGMRIRENYAQFPEISRASNRSYTFRSPTGLLNATQFAQPAIMLFDVAMAAEMRAQGVFDEGALVAGHSLGEYGALAAFGIMTLEDIIDITFIRGMTMQSIVERDSLGNSDFALVAANPSRVAKGFTESSLEFVIGAVRQASSDSVEKQLLEIVNYNVQGYQYVVAGTRALLEMLGAVLDYIHDKHVNVGRPAGKQAVEKEIARLQGTLSGGKELKRGCATIPIPGIDVPFHSSHLLPGAAQFRECIHKMIRETSVDTAALAGRYIPNLTAATFQVSREYFELMYKVTQSPVIFDELSKWPTVGSDEAVVFEKKELSRLARLLVIELLSYQFASPVLWIETQNHLFSELGAKQMVEIGPNSTLCRMAEGSLTLLGLDTQVSVLHVLSNEQQVFYQYYNDDEKDVEAHDPPSPSLKEEEEAEAEEEQLLLSESSSDTVSGSTTGNIDNPAVDVEVDVPLTALAVVRAIIAQKLRVPLGAVVGVQTVRELTGGKSTLQNEILGDLLKEFATDGTKTMDLMAAIPDNPDELTLEQLAQVLGPSFSGTQLNGKHTMMQVARLFSTKMPGAFSQSAFRTALAEGYNGMHKRCVQDGVLLTAMTMEPATRVDGVPAALAWLQSVVKVFAENANIPFASMVRKSGALAKSSSANRNRHQYAGMENDSAEQRKLAADKMAAYAQYLGIDLRQGHRLHEEANCRIEVLQQQVAELHDELGSGFISGIRPHFDKRKVRVFDSYWNWAREDALALVYEAAAASSSSSSSSGLAEGQTEVVVDQSRVLALANRADDRLIKLVTALACTGNARARRLACHLKDQCIAARDKAPVYRETATAQPLFAQYLETISSSGSSSKHPPLVHLRSKNEWHAWEYCERKSSTYYACLQEAVAPGVSFAGRTVLISGCSKGSIGTKVLQRLLSGGARVVATTSSYQSRETLLFYEALYKQHGARGSELVVVPFNQGSAQDVRALVDYVYGARGWYLDYVLPFAAMSDYGTDVSSLGPESELSTRVMLTNVLRLLGEVRRRNQGCAHVSRPATLAVLPLSPNHGVFGNDGMYGEAKAALETVFNRWESEAWHPHLAIAGAVIGWTRGTGLMAANDAVAPAMEIDGARTFSADEMAANVVALMHQRIVDLAQTGPVWADLNGGLQRIGDIGKVVADARQTVRDNAKVARAIASGYGADMAVASGHALAALHTDYMVEPLFNPRTFFPDATHRIRQQQSLNGMVNLDKVVVITGYGEVGPYGNAETRWEMEAFGEFSLEGCVELAWVMGLIKHSGGAWVDAQSGMLVEDSQIKARYEPQILKHTGVRLLEPELLDGVDPALVPIMRELQVDHDLEPFEATADEAAQFKLRSGSKVDVWEHAQGVWHVRFRKGAVLMVPKALRFDRLVGAQLPTGWTPERYGIPSDVVKQVDPVTCYALCATAEALVRSGITDPYELYKYFHVSQVGSSLGSGAGGVHAIRDLYRNRLTDTHVQSDILQETFANTTVAWINMLLLSTAGVIRPPMGGCATAALSIDVAADTIRCGKARVMVAGGFEGFVDQGSYEFAQMGATGSSADDMAAGRHPEEMSRPCTSTRTGFVEAQGAGVVILMSASAALACGAPVYGVLAHSASATDKQGVSLPAPGKGILTSAAQCRVQSANSATGVDRLLDLEYRREQLARATSAIDALADATAAGSDMKADAMRRAALDVWGADFWHGIPEISPLRGSLAAWGLTADDIGLASFHGTGTVSNDLNETMVLNKQMEHLGRSPGLALPVVAQKWLTGHPKGPAGAWMLNSAIQSMRTGLIPGNRNADNIDAKLQCEYAVFPSRTLQTDKVKACLLKSFGFGQVGAEILVIHPDYFLASLDEEQLVAYNEKVAVRNRAAYRYWHDIFAGNHTLVQVKHSPPYTADQEESVLLNPLARARYNQETNEYAILT